MKKIMTVLLVLILGIISCGTGNNGKTTENENMEKGSKKLVVGTDGVFPPFGYMENGKVVGFDMDLISEIAKNLGYEVEFKVQSFDSLIPSLKAGKLDVIASGMSATEERKKSVDFTEEYFMSKQVYLRKKGNMEVISKDDLKGKKIGVQLGTIQEIEAKKIDSAQVMPNEATANIIMDLNAGKNDVVILEDIVALEYMKKNPDIEIFYEEELPAGMAFAFDKGKHTELVRQFNEELKKLRENGKYEELINKYNLKY